MEANELKDCPKKRKRSEFDGDDLARDRIRYPWKSMSDHLFCRLHKINQRAVLSPLRALNTKSLYPPPGPPLITSKPN